MIEMTIESVRVSLMNYQRVVILKEKTADRYLPIWIGPAEAEAIAVQLQEVPVVRPLTHDLLRSMINQLGGVVRYIVVSDLSNDTFYAKILIELEGKTIEVDSRPSDALALAVRVSVPIYAEEMVLEKAGISLDGLGKGEGKGVDGVIGDEANKQVDEEELRRMSAFREFINSLDLDDFEKKQGSRG
ncbi:MAG: bifunctional nuclease family protein [Dehalococcoidia bacterium]|nr:bifunctional nuclease family protein [Dehalococcoidia bacterium]